MRKIGQTSAEAPVAGRCHKVRLGVRTAAALGTLIVGSILFCGCAEEVPPNPCHSDPTSCPGSAIEIGCPGANGVPYECNGHGECCPSPDRSQCNTASNCASNADCTSSQTCTNFGREPFCCSPSSEPSPSMAGSGGHASVTVQNDTPPNTQAALGTFSVLTETSIFRNLPYVLTGSVVHPANASFPMPATVTFTVTPTRGGCPGASFSSQSFTLHVVPATGTFVPALETLSFVGECPASAQPGPGAPVSLHFGDTLAGTFISPTFTPAGTVFNFNVQQSLCAPELFCLQEPAANGGACTHNTGCMSGFCSSTGTCQPAPCTTPDIMCSGTCVNPNSDPNNCGTCGDVCTAPTGGTTSCVGGACAPACGTGTALCGTGPSAACVNTQSNVNNCGACGNVCNSRNGTASCTNGGCSIVCSPGYSPCTPGGYCCPTGSSSCGPTC